MITLFYWNGIIFITKKQQKSNYDQKNCSLRLGSMANAPYKDLDELMQQAEFFVDAVSGYRCDFALFPEFFNAPLMAENNHLSTPEAIRELAKHTNEIVQRFQN